MKFCEQWRSTCSKSFISTRIKQFVRSAFSSVISKSSVKKVKKEALRKGDFIKKEALRQGTFCDNCKLFKNTYFYSSYRGPPLAAYSAFWDKNINSNMFGNVWICIFIKWNLVHKIQVYNQGQNVWNKVNWSRTLRYLLLHKFW